jgi:hypothetical protein
MHAPSPPDNVSGYRIVMYEVACLVELGVDVVGVHAVRQGECAEVCAAAALPAVPVGPFLLLFLVDVALSR